MCNTMSTESEIEVCITDLILTPLTCASLVNEILKCLVYGKSQIPYPYTWLKSVVNRKRKNSDQEAQRNVNFTVERYYREVFSAYSTLEDIMTNISKEFGSGNVINEVVVLFGSTLYSIKEMFRIKIPNLAKGHMESNHLSIAFKNQHKILREVFFSNEWMNAMEVTMAPTNMFVLLKKTAKEDVTSFFNLNRQYSNSKRLKSTSISLNYVPCVPPTCCNSLSIFQDVSQESSSKSENMDCSMNNVEFQWFEANVLFKGFKDCYIDKVSASELW